MKSAVLDIGSLPRQPKGSDSPEWWGILWLVVIEAVVFTGAMASYYHLKILNQAWPPPGIPDPELLLPTVNTIILMVSAAPVWYADRAMRRGDTRPARIGLPVGILLLLVFLAVKVYEYSGKGWGVSTHAYGSAVMLMTGLHMAHVAAVAIKTSVILRYIHSGRVEPERAAPLTANAIYWYFVAGIWVPLYATIYLSPYLLP